MQEAKKEEQGTLFSGTLLKASKAKIFTCIPRDESPSLFITATLTSALTWPSPILALLRPFSSFTPFMDQLTVPVRSVIGSFYSDLLRLEIDELKAIDIAEHPKWARRVIDAERKRRKNNGDSAPSKAEKSRILSFGEGKPNTAVAAAAANNETPTGPSGRRVRKKQVPKEARTEIDGEPLHDHVVDILEYSIAYDKNLQPSNERSLSVFGTMECRKPGCRNRWVSGICATVLEFSRRNKTYRTTIHSQRCQDCLQYAEPSLDPDSYSKKVTWVLDLWTGYREAVPPTTRKSPSGPHAENLCHACDVDKCPWKKRRDETIDSEEREE